MTKNRWIFLALGIIILIHILILTRLIYFPYPELFIYPYLTNHGLKPYSQILDQHFPGLLFLPINFNNLGMTTPTVARLWSISVVIVVQVMLFLISSELFKSKRKALFVNLFFLIWQPFFEGWVLWIDSFMPLFLLPAFYVLYRRWFFITGLLLGIAIVFKQTIIPLSVLILIYIFLTTRNLKITLRFLMGVFIPVSLMVSYFISTGLFGDFWYWTVVFNLTTYAQSGLKAPPSAGFINRVLLVYAVSFLASLSRDKKLSIAILIFMVGSLIGAFERADFVHFQPSLPFAILATVYGLGNLGQLRRLGALGLYGLIALWWLITFYKGHIGDRIISFDHNTYKLADKIRIYTVPGEKIFVFGSAQHLYQMTNTLPAGNIFVFQFPWFLKVAEGRILEGIIKDSPNIIVSERISKIEGQRIREFAKDIDQYINQNYEKIDNVGTTEILHRKS